MDVATVQRRIVIVGAQGTGKTTLLKNLIPYIDLPLIMEVSRTVAKILGISQDGHIARRHRLEWQRGILWWQIALEESYGSFVSDRSLIDHWAYSKLWLSDDKDFIDTFGGIVVKQAMKYTHIIYLPPTLPLKENGFRFTDSSYISEADKIIKELLTEWYGPNSGKIKALEQVALDARVEESLAFINSLQSSD
jgi:nicotinamide riboside kinase